MPSIEIRKLADGRFQAAYQENKHTQEFRSTPTADPADLLEWCQREAVARGLDADAVVTDLRKRYALPEVPEWAKFRYCHPGAEPLLLPCDDVTEALRVAYDLLPGDAVVRLRHLQRRDGDLWVPATHTEKLFHLYVLKTDGSRCYLTGYPEPADKAATIRSKNNRQHLVAEERDDAETALDVLEDVLKLTKDWTVREAPPMPCGIDGDWPAEVTP